MNFTKQRHKEWSKKKLRISKTRRDPDRNMKVKRLEIERKRVQNFMGQLTLKERSQSNLLGIIQYIGFKFGYI